MGAGLTPDAGGAWLGVEPAPGAGGVWLGVELAPEAGGAWGGWPAGWAGGVGEGLLFKKGEIVKKVPQEQLVDELFALIDTL